MMSRITTLGPNCTLGEGPLWHPLSQRLFWFDIPAGILYGANQTGEAPESWSFGEPASAAGWIDEHQLLVATASGLVRLDLNTSKTMPVCGLEEDNRATRSNDGRVGPDGSFWIGTMALDMAPRAGAFYRLKKGVVEPLFDQVSIPNATCFSPDGRLAYLADTRRQVIWRWALDEAGDPVGEKQVHINLRDEGLFPDGAVCDSQGYLWNAQWGAGRVARYAPDGSFDSAISLPASQVTCPAFGGADLKTLHVTSARQGLSEAQLASEPDAGKVFCIETGVSGIAEHRVVL